MADGAVFHWVKREKRLLFWVSVVIIALLSVLLLRALEREMARAEEAMFRTVVAELNAMLVVKTAEKIAQNRKLDVKNFVNHNPMDWMKQPPVNYSGTIEGDYKQVPAGHWFFAQRERAIIYRVINTARVVIADSGEAEFIAFRVVLDYLDENQNARFDISTERLVGLKLRPLQQYRWLPMGD